MKNGQGWPRLPDLIVRYLANLPRFCCFCHRKSNNHRDLCEFCERQLPRLVTKLGGKSANLCLKCGTESSGDEVLQACAECVKYRTPIRKIICPFRYDFPVEYLIGRLKYSRHLPTGHLLGSLLAQHVIENSRPDEYPDLIIPVPLSQKRYRERGFNHSVEIAKSCGAILGVPVRTDLVGRHFDTGSLAGLSRAERSLKIRGAFWCVEGLRSMRIAIVDDVLTTGATSGELATELSDSGVGDIALWVVARTPSKWSLKEASR